jgi:hypothetical protein
METPLLIILINILNLKNKIDTNANFTINGLKNPMFKDVNLGLGNVSFGKRDIGYFKEFGDTIPSDSIYTSTEKHIDSLLL